MPDLLRAAKGSRAWACYDCGKCTASCPIARSGSALSPRRHVLNTNLHDRETLVNDDTLYACLSCGACDQRCPAQVGYTELVKDLRALAYRDGKRPECPHGEALQSVMRMMARGGPQQNRVAWVSDAKSLRTETHKGDVFYWTGCAVYYDAFFPEFNMAAVGGLHAAVRLMNSLGITPVVSPDERCCGHDLLFNGDVENFEKLARHNVQLVADSGAELLVTSCAECLRTWTKDYEPFFAGKAPKIVHISELLVDRMGDLSFKGGDARKVTFQDACRMGRHLGVYDAPRKLLEQLPGVDLAEMRHNKVRATCCAGGTWSNCDRFAKQIQVGRLREARATGADVLVTACPKCQIHFRCAMKDPNLGSEIEIEMCDVAEVVADALDEG